MKKILIVSDYLDKIWGIETYIANLKNILQDDFEIEYFGARNISKFKKYFYLIFSFFNFIFARKFQSKLQEYQPDVVRFHSVSRLLWPAVLQKIEKFKWIKIMTYHDLWYFGLFADSISWENQIANKFSFWEFLWKSSLWKLLFPYSVFKYLKLKNIRKILSKNIDFHTVPSDFMKKYVIDLWYWREENTEILANFINKNQIVSRQEKYQDKINFVFFGRLEAGKWFWILLYFLSELWNLKFSNKEKYQEITGKIRIFIFWDGSKKKDLVENFIWEDMYGQDISILQDLQNADKIDNFIDSQEQKFVYYFWKRNFQEILNFLSFSHFELVPSVFLETFGLSALEWAANGVVPIAFDKENIKHFILEKYLVEASDVTDNYSNKIFEIIENFDIKARKSDSEENAALVKKFII